jgi:UDP-galactopyranose mutase
MRQVTPKVINFMSSFNQVVSFYGVLAKDMKVQLSLPVSFGFIRNLIQTRWKSVQENRLKPTRKSKFPTSIK